MAERLPRKVERAISIGLIGVAAIGGYALGESGNGHSSAANKAKIVATAPASPKPTETKTTAPKPKPTHSATSVPVLKKADMQPPLTPTGGDYNTAEEAAWNADNSDISTAVSQLSHVTLSDIKGKASEAISYGIAAEAAFDATNDDFATAKSLETKITDPALVGKVEQTISQEKSGNTDGANNTWDDLYNTANSTWDDLYDQANSEWDTLYMHTDGYKQSYDQAK